MQQYFRYTKLKLIKMKELLIDLWPIAVIAIMLILLILPNTKKK